MGFIDFIKSKVVTSSKRVRDEELNSYLLGARNNIKLASEHIAKFLDSVRDFYPAKRHEELYHNEVKHRLINIRAGMHKGLVFLDEKTGNEINTINPIKSPSQLKEMIEGWIRNIQANDEKVYDILKILQVEMWGEDRARRGFPVPNNKEMICGYLTSSVNYLMEVRNSLDNYLTMSSVPEA